MDKAVEGGMVALVDSGGEVPGRGLHIGRWDVNFGGSYTVWKDYANFYAELYGFLDFSGGVMQKPHLK